MLVESEIVCPHCGETLRVPVDTSEGEFTTIEDCAVCCRPIQIHAQCEPGEVLSIDIQPA